MSRNHLMRLCGLAVIVVGTLVLVGWIFDVPALKTVLPGLASMKANTAVALVAAGTAVILSMPPHTTVRTAVAIGLALLVSFIAVVTLGQYAFGVDTGLDTLLFADPQTPGGGLPGRPSLATAAELGLAGTALLSLAAPSRWTRMVLWAASLAGLLIALFAMLNYAYDPASLYAIGALGSIAIHTAVTFAILFCGLLLWSCRDSLRLPMLSLAVLVLAPLAAVMVHFADVERQLALANSQERAIAAARLLVAEQSDIFSQAHALLMHIARVHDVDSDVGACDRSVKSLASLYSWITLLRVSNMAGDSICASDAAFARINFTDRQFFKDAIRLRRFVVSDVLISAVSKEPRLVAAMPLFERGRVVGVVSMGMNLSVFADLIRRMGLEPGTSAIVVDRSGTVVAQQEGGADLVGVDISASPVVARAISGRSGTADAFDWNGQERLFAFQAVPNANVFVLVGLDKQSLIASINKTLRGRLFFIALIMGAAALAGLIGAEMLIFRPLRALARAARLIEAGDLTARPAMAGSAEVGALGRALTRMADAVADRERRLNDALTRHTAVFDSASDGIITVNESGSIESFNAAAERLFGHSAASMVRRRITNVLSDGGPEAPSFADLHGALPGRGEVREMTGLHADGSVFPADVALSEMKLGDRRLVVAIVRDASERKRVDQLKNEFVSTVSHELRTPLTSIAGSLGLLAGGAAGSIPDGAKRLISIAHQNSQRLIRLINDILDLEKIESGKMAFARNPVALHELAAEAVDASQGLAQAQDVRLTLASGSDLTVLADRDRLMQVVTNLLSNAVKFSPPGGEVRVSVARRDAEARLSIADQGPGIPVEFRARIFSKFAQADSSDARRKGGTGLGLAIAKEIAERHGGNISFDTGLGRGTVFHVDLPLPAAAVPQEGKQVSADVLIVEDNHDTAVVFGEILSRSGFTIAAATTAAQAEAMTEQGEFKVVLVDLGLPDRDGISLIRALRARERMRLIPIIVVTARPRDGAGSAEADALHVLDWLEKPVAPERLKAALELAAGPAGDARILHVDDDPDVRHVLTEALARTGSIHSVSTLAEAERAIAAFDFDVVILDMNLPDGSGSELLPKLRRRSGESIPVVVFSAHDTDPDLALKVRSVLTKTHNSLDQLVRIVARLCRPTAPPDAPRMKVG